MTSSVTASPSRRELVCGAAFLAIAAIASSHVAHATESKTSDASNAAGEQPSDAQEEAARKVAAGTEPFEADVDLTGRMLNIYCGAGMTNPFQEIADAFAEATGCEMSITFANAAQIQTQITTTEEGDFFIAGSVEELEPVTAYVADTMDLVKHIPVLVVPADNPKGIAGLADLANANLVLVGDPESTPIGKIAKKALTKLDLWDQLFDAGVLTMTTTAPQISAALAMGEGDAGIVWKENANTEGVVIVDTADLDQMIKVIPAAQLACCADEEAAEVFNRYLDSSDAAEIWMRHGYELVAQPVTDGEVSAAGSAAGDK